MKDLHIPRSQWLLGLAVSVVAGALAGFLVDVGGDFVPRTSLFLYPMSVLYGFVVGQAVISAYQGTPNRKLRIGTLAALVAGALGGRMLVGVIVLATSDLPHPWLQYVFTLLANVLSPAVVFSVAAISLGMFARLRVARCRA